MPDIADIPKPDLKYSAKWAPVVNDYCVGCGKCVERCPHGCLVTVWDAARLKFADRCVSGGDCVTVCEDNAIHMKWLPMRGDHTIGQWHEGEEPPAGLNGSSVPGLLGRLKKWLGRG